MAENLALLSDEEKSSIRYHLGYLVVARVNSLSLGIPSVNETLFIVDASMNQIPESAVGRVRNILGVLDSLEEAQKNATTRFAAKSVEGIELNSDETDMYEKELARWSMNLAAALGAPVNMMAPRFRLMAGGAIPLVGRVYGA